MTADKDKCAECQVGIGADAWGWHEPGLEPEWLCSVCAAESMGLTPEQLEDLRAGGDAGIEVDPCADHTHGDGPCLERMN